MRHSVGQVCHQSMTLSQSVQCGTQSVKSVSQRGSHSSVNDSQVSHFNEALSRLSLSVSEVVTHQSLTLKSVISMRHSVSQSVRWSVSQSIKAAHLASGEVAQHVWRDVWQLLQRTGFLLHGLYDHLTQLHQVLNGLQARRLVNCKPTTPAQSVTHD